jgi:hypothetical protein
MVCMHQCIIPLIWKRLIPNSLLFHGIIAPQYATLVDCSDSTGAYFISLLIGTDDMYDSSWLMQRIKVVRLS